MTYSPLFFFGGGGGWCSRKLVKYSGETVIRILQLLSQYIKDPLEAGKFLDILLPFLAKGVKDSGKSTS